MTVRENGISFHIRHRIGVLAVYQSGWRKEANLVEWNGGSAKVDIRDWDPSHEHMGKGVTLYPEEAEKLQWVLYRYFTGRGAELLRERQPSPEPPAAAEPGEMQEPVSEIPAVPEIAEGLFCGQDCMLDVEEPDAGVSCADTAELPQQEMYLEGALLEE